MYMLKGWFQKSDKKNHKNKRQVGGDWSLFWKFGAFLKPVVKFPYPLEIKGRLTCEGFVFKATP